MQAGKIAKLQEMLPEMKKKGDRVLIFSQFTQVLDILEVVLDTMELKYLKLTGQTAVGERQGLVDAYNNNEDITVFRAFGRERCPPNASADLALARSLVDSCRRPRPQPDGRQHRHIL